MVIFLLINYRKIQINVLFFTEIRCSVILTTTVTFISLGPINWAGPLVFKTIQRHHETAHPVTRNTPVKTA
jgi:hypothetical protein